MVPHLVREHEAALDEPLVPGVEHGVEHALVEEAVAHPLGDDDVHLGHRELDLLHLAADDGHDVAQAVVRHDLLGVVDDGAHVHTDHLGRARLGSEHGENPGATPNIQNNLVLEQVLVVPHRVPKMC